MYLTGLVDLKSKEDFETSFANVVHKWKLHDLVEISGPVTRLCDWFYPHKEAMMKEHMISPVSPVFTNASESINNVINVKVD